MSFLLCKFVKGSYKDEISNAIYKDKFTWKKCEAIDRQKAQTC